MYEGKDYKGARQARSRREDPIGSLSPPSSHITIEEWRTKVRLSKKTLKEISLSESPYFMENLQLVQENVLTRTFSLFRFIPLQNFYLGISRLLKECALTYLGSDAIQEKRMTKKATG